MFAYSLVLSSFFLFLRQESLCSPGWPGTLPHSGIHCLCFLSVEIEGSTIPGQLLLFPKQAHCSLQLSSKPGARKPGPVLHIVECYPEHVYPIRELIFSFLFILASRFSYLVDFCRILMKFEF